jgi:hypothetical protein
MITTTTDARVRTLGLACAASGVLMTLLALFYFVRDDSVPVTQWSYPQSPAVFLVVSVLLAVGHALSAAGFWGVRLARATSSRVGAMALSGAAGLSLALSCCELASGFVGAQESTSATATVVSSLFGIVSLLFAAAAIIAGIVLLRGGTGTLGGLVLLTGLVIIVLVTPANISGSLVFRQISLLLWSLLFIPLGLQVAKLGRTSAG